MGVTIHYRGTLRDPRKLDEFCAELRSLVEPWGWEARPYETASRKIRIMVYATGRHEGRAVAGRLLSTYTARGLVLLPHFACEPIPFLVETHSGLLMDLEAPPPGSTIETGSRVKTQFAPIEVHVRTCKLLYEIRERFIPDLAVSDEGDYFRTGDREILELARKHVERDLAEQAREAAGRGAAWRVGFRLPRGEGSYRLLDFVVGSEKDARFQLHNTVPSRVDPGALIYVKREPKLYMTDQIGLVLDACRAHGKKFRIVAPPGTVLSQGLRAALEEAEPFDGIEESDHTADAGLYLCVLDKEFEIDYGGVEVGAWTQLELYRNAIHQRLEGRFLRKTAPGARFPLFLTRSAGGWGVEELVALRTEIETILKEASRKPPDPAIIPEYASRVRSRFRALHHCFVDTQVEPLLEKLAALCDLAIEKKLPLVMQ
ncbi:MAG: Imm70 family immunity protein [Myxococcota bacterium]